MQCSWCSYVFAIHDAAPFLVITTYYSLLFACLGNIFACFLRLLLHKFKRRNCVIKRSSFFAIESCTLDISWNSYPVHSHKFKNFRQIKQSLFRPVRIFPMLNQPYSNHVVIQCILVIFALNIVTTEKPVLNRRSCIHSCLNQLFQRFFIFDLPAICNLRNFRGSKADSRC